MTTLGKWHTPSNLSARPHIVGVSIDGVERGSSDVRIRVGRLVHTLGGISNGGMGHAHPPIEPWSTAEPAEHRNTHRACHDRPDMRSRVAEVEQGNTRSL